MNVVSLSADGRRAGWTAGTTAYVTRLPGCRVTSLGGPAQRIVLAADGRWALVDGEGRV